MPLELTPPPVGVGQALWVPAKSGCLPFSFCPRPLLPVAKKSPGVDEMSCRRRAFPGNKVNKPCPLPPVGSICVEEPLPPFPCVV